jgi:hypothetical protein
VENAHAGLGCGLEAIAKRLRGSGLAVNDIKICIFHRLYQAVSKSKFSIYNIS